MNQVREYLELDESNEIGLFNIFDKFIQNHTMHVTIMSNMLKRKEQVAQPLLVPANNQ